MIIFGERKQGNHLFSTIKTNRLEMYMSRDPHGAMEITSCFFCNCPIAYNNVVVQTLHVTRELICKHPVSLLKLFFFLFLLFYPSTMM